MKEACLSFARGEGQSNRTTNTLELYILFLDNTNCVPVNTDTNMCVWALCSHRYGCQMVCVCVYVGGFCRLVAADITKMLATGGGGGDIPQLVRGTLLGTMFGMYFQSSN